MCSSVSLIPIAAGVSAARAIRRCSSLEAVLKWPNDVMIDNKKVAGILVESSLTPMECIAVTGFGVNANSYSTQRIPELADQAVSISDAGGSIVDVDRLMREIVDDFAEVYNGMFSRGQLTVVSQWKEFSEMLSKPSPDGKINGAIQGQHFEAHLTAVQQGRQQPFPENKEELIQRHVGTKIVLAPMSGRITSLVVRTGQRVHAGQALVILEAMKMENEIISPWDGTIDKIHGAEGTEVRKNEPIISLA